MNELFNQLFNPQCVNMAQYRRLNKSQYDAVQNGEVAKAVKAIHDLCEAIKHIDDGHRDIAFSACLAEIAKEFNWV